VANAASSDSVIDDEAVLDEAEDKGIRGPAVQIQKQKQINQKYLGIFYLTFFW
jgi:hypothetical protein